MILFELTNSEQNQVYQDLEISNGNRQYDFLRSIFSASLAMKRLFLSQHIIKALNFHAITCLHINAGEYRPCQVFLTGGTPEEPVTTHTPVEPYRVQPSMDDLVNFVNRSWETSDAVVLAAYVLWRMNHIHPFINGNGRTARATCYFVLCLKAGVWLPGNIILPELIRRNRARYVDALQQVDQSALQGELNLTPLHALLEELLVLQLSDVAPSAENDDPGVPVAAEE